MGYPFRATYVESTSKLSPLIVGNYLELEPRYLIGTQSWSSSLIIPLEPGAYQGGTRNGYETRSR
jgi:hypothetical protein